jgi:hypothetical protein
MLKTGEGLESEDIAKGIAHIDEKREAICPLFERFDRKFGACANVKPFEVIDSANRVIIKKEILETDANIYSIILSSVYD